MSIQKASGTCGMRLAANGERKFIRKPRVVLSCVFTSEVRAAQLIALTSAARVKLGGVGDCRVESYRAGDYDGGFNGKGFNRKVIAGAFWLYGATSLVIGDTVSAKALVAANGAVAFFLDGDVAPKTIFRAESAGTHFTLGTSVVEKVSRYGVTPGFDLPFNLGRFNAGTLRQQIPMYGTAGMPFTMSGKAAIITKPRATANIDLRISANTTQILNGTTTVRLALDTQCAATVRHYAFSTNGFVKPFNLGRFNVTDRQKRLVFYGENGVMLASNVTPGVIVAGKASGGALRLAARIREVVRTFAVGEKVNLQLYVDGVGKRYGYGSTRLGFDQSFNRYGFNIKPSGGQTAFYASERMTFRSYGTAVTLFRSSLSVDLSLDTSGHYRIRGVSPAQDVNLRLVASGVAAIARYDQSDGFHRMFNRAGFNTWTYDKTATRYGIAVLELDTHAYCRSIAKPQAILDLRLRSDVNLRHKAMFPPERVDLRLHTSRATIITGKRTTASVVLLLRILPVRFYTQKSEYLTLSGLTLKPGDMLRIDTENCVATVNGLNVMEYLTDDSTFFYLLNGENLIVCENGGANAMSELKVMWRNRYL